MSLDDDFRVLNSLYPNNRSLAQALGVSVRSVQRYQTTATQKYKPSKKVQQRIEQLVSQETADLYFQGEVTISRDTRFRTFTLRTEARKAFPYQRAVESGNMSNPTWGAFWREYGVIPTRVQYGHIGVKIG